MNQEYPEYCSYYHAELLREKIWFVTGCLRSENSLVLERTIDKHKNLVEFFVAPHQEEDFLEFMARLQKGGYILSLEKKENRFLSA